MDLLHKMTELANNKPKTLVEGASGPLSALRNQANKGKVWCLAVIVMDGRVYCEPLESHADPTQHIKRQGDINAQIRGLQYLRNVIKSVDSTAIRMRLEQTLGDAETQLRQKGTLPGPFKHAANKIWAEAFRSDLKKSIGDVYESAFGFRDEETFFRCAHAEPHFIKKWLSAPISQRRSVSEVSLYIKTSPCVFLCDTDPDKCSKPEIVRDAQGPMVHLPAGCLNKLVMLSKMQKSTDWMIFFDSVHGGQDAQRAGRTRMEMAQYECRNLSFWLAGTQLGNTKSKFKASLNVRAMPPMKPPKKPKQ